LLIPVAILIATTDALATDHPHRLVADAGTNTAKAAASNYAPLAELSVVALAAHPLAMINRCTMQSRFPFLWHRTG